MIQKQQQQQQQQHQQQQPEQALWNTRSKKMEAMI
jgi:hypothetical protein